jgi:hypothetical protein
MFMPVAMMGAVSSAPPQDPNLYVIFGDTYNIVEGTATTPSNKNTARITVYGAGASGGWGNLSLDYDIASGGGGGGAGGYLYGTFPSQPGSQWEYRIRPPVYRDWDNSLVNFSILLSYVRNGSLSNNFIEWYGAAPGANGLGVDRSFMQGWGGSGGWMNYGGAFSGMAAQYFGADGGNGQNSGGLPLSAFETEFAGGLGGLAPSGAPTGVGFGGHGGSTGVYYGEQSPSVGGVGYVKIEFL